MEFCCTECFQNKFLKNYIASNGRKIEKCDFCESEDKLGIEASSLKAFFIPLADLYTPAHDFSEEGLGELRLSTDTLANVIAWDWEVFNDMDLSLPILESIFYSDPTDGDASLATMQVLYDIEWHEDNPEIEDSTNNKSWNDFSKEIKHQNRFQPKRFNIKTFENIARANEEILAKDSVLFRARIEGAAAYDVTKMGSPPVELAKYGRMNPQGISYLYLSNLKEVCVAEVRPNKSDSLTVGEFRVVKDLKIMIADDPVLCPFKYRDNLQEIYRSRNLLFGFMRSISIPFNPRESYLEYLPTQYICEFIKNLGFDGIKYKSSQAQGYNFALFDTDSAICFAVEGNMGVNIEYSLDSKKKRVYRRY